MLPPGVSKEGRGFREVVMENREPTCGPWARFLLITESAASSLVHVGRHSPGIVPLVGASVQDSIACRLNMVPGYQKCIRESTGFRVVLHVGMQISSKSGVEIPFPQDCIWHLSLIGGLVSRRQQAAIVSLISLVHCSHLHDPSTCGKDQCRTEDVPRLIQRVLLDT